MKSSLFFAGLSLLLLTACSAPVQTMVASTTTACASTLMLGSTTFQMETIQLAPDGSLPVLAKDSNHAYWIDGTDRVFIFILKSTPENLSLVSTITTGSIATATWSNCVSITYTLSAPQQGSFGITYLPDQTTSGAQIFLQPDSSGNGMVINGETVEE